MTDIPVIETDRLLLRDFRPDDLDAMTAMWAMPEVVRFIGGTPLSREQSWQRLVRQIGMWHIMGFGFWAIIEKSSGALVGEGGFHEMRRTLTPSIENTMEAGWGLIPEAQGRGYASEALSAMLDWAKATHPGQPITCIIDEDNEASLNFARKHGFEEFAKAQYAGSEVKVLKKKAA